jgi:hypothetical protein
MNWLPLTLYTTLQNMGISLPGRANYFETVHRFHHHLTVHTTSMTPLLYQVIDKLCQHVYLENGEVDDVFRVLLVAKPPAAPC